MAKVLVVLFNLHSIRKDVLSLFQVTPWSFHLSESRNLLLPQSSSVQSLLSLVSCFLRLNQRSRDKMGTERVEDCFELSSKRA